MYCFIVGICRHAYVEMAFNWHNNATTTRFHTLEECWQSCLGRTTFHCNSVEFITINNNRVTTTCNLGSVHTNDLQMSVRPDLEVVTLVRCVQLQ